MPRLALFLTPQDLFLSLQNSYEWLIILKIFYPAFLVDNDRKIFRLSYSTILLEVQVTMEILKNVLCKVFLKKESLIKKSGDVLRGTQD